jgi:hypothetical protein
VGLPPLGTYTIKFTMLDSNPLNLKFYTITPAEIFEDAISQAVIFQDVPAAAGGLAAILYNPLADPATLILQLDLNADGIAEQLMSPGGILTNLTATDLTPPASSIQVQGAANGQGYYTGTLVITLSAVDAGSGVHKIEYSLDGGLTGKVYTAPFTIEAKDVPVLYVKSTDNAGNSEYPWVKKDLYKENPIYHYFMPFIFK